MYIKILIFLIILHSFCNDEWNIKQNITNNNDISILGPFPTFENIVQMQRLISNDIIKTNLVQFELENDKDTNKKMYLKLENLQPGGSYKIRSAFGVMRYLISQPDIMSKIYKNGIATASTGNFSQALARALLKLNIDTKLYILVPYHVADIKLETVKNIYKNIIIIKLSPQTWIETVLAGVVDFNKISKGEYKTDTDIDLSKLIDQPLYISPTSNPYGIAGGGTIGLEIIEQNNNVNCIIIPYGGGGMTIGISTVMKHYNSLIKIFVAESQTSSCLKTSLDKNTPTFINLIPSFADGLGGPSVIPHIFEEVKKLIEGSLVVSLDDIANTVKILAEKNKIVVEGAGAASVAAMLKYKNSDLHVCDNIVCIISGGNIDTHKLADILLGNTPKI